ncbi:Ldh family oxidoreductase [Sinorhizobium meliloti]|uniref:Ldh family oxidoreductase n=1 Tax=Rhizobium meliloti TaxID=382 RepID=UPI003D65354A
MTKPEISQALRTSTITIQVPKLHGFMVDLLVAGGISREDARKCSDVFLDADMKGIGLQGLDHISTLLRHVKVGRTNPSASPKLVRETAATAVIDGDFGLGQISALVAVDIAIRKAREAGCATVGVINGGDVFMVGHYAERIARANLVAFVFSDSPPLVHVAGGVERSVGTNPLAIGFPSAGEDPIVHDMSTSAISASRIRQAAYFGEELPDGLGVNKDGKPTNKAADIREGAIAPLAGHKGFGLALSVALLAGPLVGALCGKALDNWMTDEPGPGASRGQLFIAIDPAAFGDPDVFRRKVTGYADEIKGSAKAPGVKSIRVPGERGYATRRQQYAGGTVEMYQAVWDRAVELGRTFGVTAPEVTRKA